MAKYDRDGAITYAKKWCLGHNPAYPNFDAMGEKNSDCANFVSQCLHEGGGMPMKYTGATKYLKWYYNSLEDRAGTWADVQSLRLFIKQNKTETPRLGYTFLSNSQVGQLVKGDVVFALEGTGDKAARRAKHVALVSRVVGTDIFVYAHSEPRNDEKWRYALADTILCHFDGTIYMDGNEGGGDTSSWSARYGVALLKKSNTYNVYVKNLQEDLIKLGYNCGDAGADGYYGDDTVTAVKNFQGNNGLTADGLAGDKTKEKLYNLLY